jgi:hypothetical protein
MVYSEANEAKNRKQRFYFSCPDAKNVMGKNGTTTTCRVVILGTNLHVGCQRARSRGWCPRGYGIMKDKTPTIVLARTRDP